MKTLISITLILAMYSASFAQSDQDYKVLNLVINKYSDKIQFLTYLNPATKTLEPESPEENTELYLSIIEDLIQENITSSSRVTKRKLKKTYIHWDKNKITYPVFTDKEEEHPFFYYTKPIFVTKDHFVILNYCIIAGGGITAILYKLDEVNNQVIRIKGKMILRYGLNFR